MLLGLLVLLELECRILIGVGLLVACMRALEETINKQRVEAIGITTIENLTKADKKD